MKKIVSAYLILFLLNQTQLNPLSIGSNTVPSRQPHITFPQSHFNNTMLGFAVFENGFTLQTNKTTCTYDDFFPISGKINMRGGQLLLKRDLLLSSSFNFTTSGSIIGGNHLSFEFGPILNDVSLSVSLTFSNIVLVMNNELCLHAPLEFKGRCKIKGQGNFISMEPGAKMIIRPNAILELEDIGIVGLAGNNISCMVDSGSLVLRNSFLMLDRNYTFTRGSILFDEDVIISGTNAFHYGSGLTSTLASGATLLLDYNLVFSYDPRLPRSDLMQLTDNTSNLFLNNATLHVTRTGLQLSQGNLLLDNRVTLSSEGRALSESLRLDSSLGIKILNGAYVDFFGTIVG